MTRNEEIAEFVAKCDPVKMTLSNGDLYLLRRDTLESILNCAYAAGGLKALTDPTAYVKESSARHANITAGEPVA